LAEALNEGITYQHCLKRDAVCYPHF